MKRRANGTFAPGLQDWKLGDKHWAWQGDTPTKTAVHQRLYRARGKASEYPCVDCGLQARDWSQVKNTEGYSIDDFEPRCRSCHTIYDGKSKFTRDQALGIRQRIENGECVIHLAREFKVCNRTIMEIRDGVSYR